MPEPGVEGGRRGQLASSGLRPGWTTGACATAAATAAYTALVTGEFPDPVQVRLPQGRTPQFALTEETLGSGWAMAAVTKDAGDDPDVTHGALVRATVRCGPSGAGVRFVAGPGVGTVTLPGLPLSVGDPAINPGPRSMIIENLMAVRGGAEPDLIVEVGIDKGVELARRTLNARVGVVGGLSVLGSTGVVVPYSCSAWIDSLRRGIDVARATGQSHVAACTGSTSERVAAELFGLAPVSLLDMGDFVGAVLKYVRHNPVPRLTLCGGVAKLSKLAQGHLDLHSARSRVDIDHLVGLARGAGAGEDVVVRLRSATGAADAVGSCARAGVPLGDAIAASAWAQAMDVLRAAPVSLDVVCLDRSGRVVGRAGQG